MFGSINIHSAVNRAALVHTIIADNNIDLLALQETWINADDPKAVQAHIAPAGYSILHVHRPAPKDTRRNHDVVGSTRRLLRGGGLAIVCRQELNVMAHRLQLTTYPSTFEYQLTSVKTNSSTGIIKLSIYRCSHFSMSSPICSVF